MGYFRSVCNGGGSGEDYSATYTTTINNTIQKGSCAYMFCYNNSFNNAVTIGSNVIDCQRMFLNCTALNQPVTIGESVNNCYAMFWYCNSFNSNIYFKGNTYRAINVNNFLTGANSQKTKNIFFNVALNNVFNVSNSVMPNITWTATTNGFYNATYNIYCYYNYTG